VYRDSYRDRLRAAAQITTPRDRVRVLLFYTLVPPGISNMPAKLFVSH
jgi:hypothetical protein